MKRYVYLDNAATTPIRPEVLATMVKVLEESYGNPSSIYQLGRHAKALIETSRKTIAKTLQASAQEIIFTSGGTESNNWILRSVVKDLKVQRIITGKIEHHAVLHTIEALQKDFFIQVEYVALLPNGDIDVEHLEILLSKHSRITLVSLMHVNNETGAILDLEKVGTLCSRYQALFHSDTIQSIGKYPFDLQKLPIDFLVASAHKFHGPKGTGFAYIKKKYPLKPLFFGGEQEKGMRPGTEAVHNIVGMATALEISYQTLQTERQHSTDLKEYAIKQFTTYFPNWKRNGNPDHSFYNILNVLLPFSEDKTAMILFHLDMKGIAVSRGSACQSGSTKPSHVLQEILSKEDTKKPSLRLSFSYQNTTDDIDLLIKALQDLK